MNITPRERQCIELVAKLCDERQVPVGPTVIAAAMGCSKVNAFERLRTLADRRQLKVWDGGKNRRRYSPLGWKPLAIDGPIAATVKQAAEQLRGIGEASLADKLLKVTGVNRTGAGREALSDRAIRLAEAS